MTIWEILKISKTTDKKQIKAAYATALKDCHPEEKPAEFMELKKAYESALQYASGKTDEEQAIETSVPENNENQSGNSLLNALDEVESQTKDKVYSSPAFTEFKKILEDKTRCNDNSAWRSYIESEIFWDDMFEQDFLDALKDYLANQTIFPVKELPQAMVQELSIAYVITVDDGTKRVWIEESDYSNKEAMEWHTVYPADYVMAEIWNGRSDVDQNIEYTENRVSITRTSAYSYMRTIYNHIHNEEQWADIDNQLECCKYNMSMGREVFQMTDEQAATSKIYVTELADDHIHVIFLKMMNYLIRKYRFSIEICDQLFKMYKLNELEQSKFANEYEPIKEIILEMYPDIVAYGEQNITLKEYKADLNNELKKLQEKYGNQGWGYKSKYATDAYVPSEEDKEEMAKLLSTPSFKKYQYESEVINSLCGCDTTQKEAEAILDVYYNDEMTKRPDVMKLILDCYHVFFKNMLRKERIHNKKFEYEFNINNKYFWIYFLQVAFGDRAMKISENMRPVHPNDMYGPYLTMYSFIENVLEPSKDWRRQFVNYDFNDGDYKNGRNLVIKLAEDKEVVLEFHYYYVNYYIKGKQILNQVFDAKILSKVFAEDDFGFMLLLPICHWKPEDEDELFDRIIKFISSMFGAWPIAFYLSNQIINNNSSLFITENLASRKYLENLDDCYRLDTDSEGKSTLYKFNKQLGMYEDMDISQVGKHYRRYIFFQDDKNDSEGYDMENFQESMISLPYPKYQKIYSVCDQSGKEKIQFILDLLKNTDNITLVYGDMDRSILQFKMVMLEIPSEEKEKELLPEYPGLKYNYLYRKRYDYFIDEPYNKLVFVDVKNMLSKQVIAVGESGKIYYLEHMEAELIVKSSISELLEEILPVEHLTDIIEFTEEKRSDWK